MTIPQALIIEDDPKLVEIYSQALKIAGFMVRTAADGQEALDILQELVPAVILLDLHLPKLNGDQVLAQIHQNNRLANTFVILATSDAIMADSLREQADFILLKPVSFGQLRDLGARLITTQEK
jgi:CheY-like chemotaxis protein